MKDNQDLYLIEDYLNNKLEGQSLIDFRNRLLNDKEFKDLYDDHKASFVIVNIAGREKLKKQLYDIHNNMDKSGHKNTLSVLFKIAAVFIGILAVSSLLYYSLSFENNYNRLYSDNFEPYTNLLTTKGESDTSDEQILTNNAMYEYDMKNYNKANLSFKRLLELKKNNDTVLFYYGISKLGAGDSEEAIKLLTNLEKDSLSLFSRFGHVKWYLALAYIKYLDELKIAGNTDSEKVNSSLIRCKSLLNEIIIDNDDYSSEAEKILKKLN